MTTSSKIFAFLLLTNISYAAGAQTVKKTEESVEKAAQKTGNKTAEIASKGKSTVVDKVYKDKVGPDGQKIYIDSHSKYYWIDKKGHKNYVTGAELKDKPAVKPKDKDEKEKE
jgi:hypothetical protein